MAIRRTGPRVLAAAGVLVALGLAGCARTPAIRPQGNPIWAVQLAWEDAGGPWPEAVWRTLAAQGVRHAEINLEWAQIEPRPGVFDFGALDADLAGASAAGVQVIPIFWDSVWTGNPPPWLPARDVTSSGAGSAIPVWWNPTEQRAYFTYVTKTIAHIRREPGFGGAFLDYGWLDAMWGQVPPGTTGVTGYAPDDVAAFHRWLPTAYPSLQAFNAAHGTEYGSWDAVPAARPGQALFAVYQAFRSWSVGATYGRLTAAVRRLTSKPLYYYWGGDLAQSGQFFNLPDIFFRLAASYHVTVVLDDANSTGLALLFGSLARAYGVQLFQEWTPSADPAALPAEAAQWLGHIGMGAPNEVGLDFFLYGGGTEFATGYPIFTRWLRPLSEVAGSYPLQPVAIYVSLAPAYTSPTALQGVTHELGDIWRADGLAFTVVTSAEVAGGTVALSHFRAVLTLTGMDGALRSYAAHGGHVLTSASALSQYAAPYITLSPDPGLVEADPTVDAATRTAWLTLAEISPRWPYSGTAEIHYAGLGLPAGTYHLRDAVSGQTLPSEPVAGGLEVPLDLAPGALELVELLPGPEPPGTPPAVLPAAQPATGAGVMALAGAPGQGLRFLNVGAHAVGSDGNVSLVTAAGQTAVATEPLSSSREPAAFVYLQIDPGSAVYGARDVRLAVTYLASPAAGFAVQYDGAGGAYQDGPAVTSPGTGAWVTADVTLPAAAFDEGQNWSADLRLLASGDRPLLVHQVTITALG